MSDRMLRMVCDMLPGAEINSLQLNRNAVCGKHKDSKNSTTESHILFFGGFKGGHSHLRTHTPKVIVLSKGYVARIFEFLELHTLE